MAKRKSKPRSWKAWVVLFDGRRPGEIYSSLQKLRLEYCMCQECRDSRYVVRVQIKEIPK